jgi:hypothetical protein
VASVPDPVRGSDGAVDSGAKDPALSLDAAMADAQLPGGDASMPMPPVITRSLPSASVSFATLGGLRSDGSYTLSGDGFEWATACDETFTVCMTGRMGP